MRSKELRFTVQLIGLPNIVRHLFSESPSTCEVMIAQRVRRYLESEFGIPEAHVMIHMMRDEKDSTWEVLP